MACVFQMCQYCHQKFCAKHQLPEEHGCGEAAREAARTKARQAFKKPTNNSGSTVDQRKKNDLKTQLRNKIGQKTQERGRKDKEAKTKKKKKWVVLLVV